MTDHKNKWDSARAIETTLERKTEEALRECGLEEDFIHDFFRSRPDQPETILPETNQEIEWRIREAHRMARHFGLHLPKPRD